MDIRQLRYFVQVIEAKSFTRAAELINTAQPALSHQILKLENELGQELLIRHSRGIEPTEAGERLLAYARSILLQVEQAKHDLVGFDGTPHGHVRLGLPRSLGDTLAIDVLETCRAQYPNISLALSEHLSGHLTELILAGRLDLALTYSTDRLDLLSYQPVLHERLCFVEPAKGEPEPGMGKIDFTEVAERPLILPGLSHFARKLVETTASYCGLHLKIIYEVDSVPVTLEMVGRGLASTIQPFLTVRRQMRGYGIRICPIVQPEISRRLHIVHLSKQALTHEQMLVRDLTLNQIRHFFRENPLEPMIQVETTMGPA